jgi:hypothetical protein
MSELTQEQLDKAETMSLEELRTLALQGDEAVVAEPKKVATARGADGKFVGDNQSDVIDNADEAAKEDEVVEEPETQVFRREIFNEDGTMDVYEGDSMEELIDKIADAKRAAVTQLKKVIAEKRTVEAKTTQISVDDEYMVGEKMKKNPKATVRDIITEVIEERLTKAARSEEVQSRFVTTHPKYIATPENGNRVSAWMQTHGYAEFTSEGLEKAYQDLTRSGLLKLKSEEADAATEAETDGKQRTVAPTAEATQQRSQRKSSTIKTTSSARSAPKVGSGPTEDELYTMPLEKLRALADKQMSESSGE